MLPRTFSQLRTSFDFWTLHCQFCTVGAAHFSVAPIFLFLYDRDHIRMKKNSSKLKTQPPADAPKEDIDALRRAIDELDTRIVALINERAANAVKIGAL